MCVCGGGQPAFQGVDLLLCCACVCVYTVYLYVDMGVCPCLCNYIPAEEGG